MPNDSSTIHGYCFHGEAIEKARSITAEKNPNLENLDEVAESVGVGAIIFHYLMNNRMRDINFVLEDALSFDGNTGPYAQYTYARTASILAKAGGEGKMTVYEQNDAEAELTKRMKGELPERKRPIPAPLSSH